MFPAHRMLAAVAGVAATALVGCNLPYPADVTPVDANADAMPPDARTSATLTLTFEGLGGGTALIFASTGNGQCTSSCVNEYPLGTLVQVFVTGDSASQFAGFTGDCLGTTCKVTMEQDRTVG